MENKDKDGYTYYQLITPKGLINTTEEKEEGTKVLEVVLEEKPKRRPRKVYEAQNSYKYYFHGPIYQWDKCVIMEFKAETIAKSEKEARSNIIYRAKKFLDLNPWAGGFKLGGKIHLVQ